MKKISKSLSETQRIAEEILEEKISPKESGARVLALSGDLGSGKTTFTQALARALGIDATIISPTFVIERIYKIPHRKFEHLIHIDAYRLESMGELEALGFKEILGDNKNLIVVEWAKKVDRLLPDDTVHVYFETINESTRGITIV